MGYFKIILSLFFVGFLSSCGGSNESSVNNGDQTPTDRVVDEPQLVKSELTVIDSTWVSGPENVIKSLNSELFVPSVSGLLVLELDSNGFIDKNRLLLEHIFQNIQIQNNYMAAHNGNTVSFFEYDGTDLQKVFETQPRQMRQIPFSSAEGCFYWVAEALQEPFLFSVFKACPSSTQVQVDEIFSSQNIILNIHAMSENELIVFESEVEGERRDSISFYKSDGSEYDLKSKQFTGSGWRFHDVEVYEGDIYVNGSASDQPGLENGGLVKFTLSNDQILATTKIADIISDNAAYDLIAVTPLGIILANDKALSHFIIENGKVVKIVSAEVPNSVSSVYVSEDYIVTVLRDPPSSFVSGETGDRGVHIFSFQDLF